MVDVVVQDNLAAGQQDGLAGKRIGEGDGVGVPNASWFCTTWRKEPKPGIRRGRHHGIRVAGLEFHRADVHMRARDGAGSRAGRW